MENCACHIVACNHVSIYNIYYLMSVALVWYKFNTRLELSWRIGVNFTTQPKDRLGSWRIYNSVMISNSILNNNLWWLWINIIVKGLQACSYICDKQCCSQGQNPKAKDEAKARTIKAKAKALNPWGQGLYSRSTSLVKRQVDWLIGVLWHVNTT